MGLEEQITEKIEEQKQRIDLEYKRKREQLEFKKYVMNKNSFVMSKYMEDNGLGFSQVYDEFCRIIPNFIGVPDPYFLENRDGMTVEEVNDSFFVKSGYYKIATENELIPEMIIEQCRLESTGKFEREYAEFNAGN